MATATLDNWKLNGTTSAYPRTATGGEELDKFTLRQGFNHTKGITSAQEKAKVQILEKARELNCLSQEMRIT